MPRRLSMCCFNSSLVRLGVARPVLLCLLFKSFNSSLVRLGVHVPGAQQTAYCQFQFQLGTIGRIIQLLKIRLSTVSIPAWYDWESDGPGVMIDDLGFNSSLVRLGEGRGVGKSYSIGVSIPAWYDWEPKTVRPTKLVAAFQFQLGTIGSKLVGVLSAVAFKFQFQLGTIGSGYVRRCSVSLHVSIPAWYDWE